MNKSEFKKAVADNEAPTPGYLYRDMASWTFTDYGTQVQLIKALMDKLHTKNSAFVLYKALHLIKVLCETGQESFQKELQLSKYTSVVKDFTTYRGPLDIKYGDSWNEKVRCEAQAALEAIFQTRVAALGTSGVGGGGGVSGGGAFGRGDWTGTGSAALGDAVTTVQGRWGSDSDAVMPSFAPMNPYGGASGSTFTALDTASAHVGEMPAENRWAAHQRDVALGHASDKPSKTLLQQLASTAKSGVNLLTQYEVLKGRQQQLYGDRFGQAARASSGPESGAATGAGGVSGGLLGRRQGVDEVGSYQPVGLALVPSSAEYTTAAGTSSSPLPPPSAEAALAVGASAEAVEVTAGPGHAFAHLLDPTPDAPASPRPDGHSISDDALLERVHLLARQRQAPSRVEVARLAQEADAAAAAAERGEEEQGQPLQRDYGVKLATALAAHLGRERPWQERLNALTLLEGVLRGPADSSAVRIGVQQYFCQHPHVVQWSASVVQASLKEKATRVAQLLGIPAEPQPSVAASPAAAARSPPAQSEPRSHFDGVLGGGTSSPASAATPPSQAAVSSVPAGEAARGGSSWDGLFGEADAFEGMTLRAGGSGASASTGARRSGGNALAGEPPQPSSSASLVSVGGHLGGEGVSRPQRRLHTAATTTASAPPGGDSRAPEATTSTRRGGPIQVLRYEGGAAATALPSSQRAPQGESLDRLFDAPALPTASAAATASPKAHAREATSLDDLFGNPAQKPPPAAAQAPPPPTAFTAEDLFGTAAASTPSPTAATSAAQLARIQQLMQYLETHYDPAAMTELEGLVLQRQQELQRLASVPVSAGDVARMAGPGVMPMSSNATAAAGESHRQFQMGGASSAQLHERQQAANMFADVQAEMKRKMEL